jgi:hypothetical protein
MSFLHKTFVLLACFSTAIPGVNRTHAQATGKEQTLRDTVAKVTAATDAENKKAGIVGWVDIEQGAGPGVRLFVKDKTTLEKIVGKARRGATFEDLREGVMIEATYVTRDSQPGAGPTLADAKRIVIFTGAK